MCMWRVSVKPTEDVNAWKRCKEQEIIAIGWPDDDSAQQVRRFEEIAEGDLVVAHVPESHGGGPARICGIGVVTQPSCKVSRAELPPGDEWSADCRRQCKVDWLSFEEHSMPSGQVNDWRGTVRRMKPEQVRAILRAYGIGNP